MLSIRDSFYSDTNRLKVKRLKRYFTQTVIKRNQEWVYQYRTNYTLSQKSLQETKYITY